MLPGLWGTLVAGAQHSNFSNFPNVLVQPADPGECHRLRTEPDRGSPVVHRLPDSLGGGPAYASVQRFKPVWHANHRKPCGCRGRAGRVGFDL